MNCEKAQSLILEHLYGDLKPREEKALTRHLQTCRACSEEYEAHKATVSSFKNIDMEEPPAGLTRTIAAMAASKIEQRRPLPAWSRLTWKPALATVAAATLAIVFVINYVPHEKSVRMAARTPSVGDAQRMQKAISLDQSRVTVVKKSAPEPETEMIVTEQDALGHFEPTRDIREGRGAYSEESNVRVDVPATGTVGGSVSGDQIAGMKRARKRQEETLFAAPPSAPPAEMKDEIPAISGKEPADLDEFKPDSKTLPPPEDKERRIASLEVYSEVAQETDAAKPEPVSSEIEEPGKTKLAYHGSDGLVVTYEVKTDRAKNESLKGDSYFGNGDFSNAAMSYQKAVALSDDEEIMASSKFRLGQSYQKLERYEQAISVYREIIDNHPEFPHTADVYIALGECHLKLGNSDEAMTNFKLVLDKFPDKGELAQERITETQREMSKNADESPAE
jgi:TolA-binding protein